MTLTAAPPPVQTGVPFLRRVSLSWSARRDGVRNIPHIDPLTDAGTVVAVTARIAILASEAEEAARAEWRNLGDRIANDHLEIESLTPAKAGVETALAMLSEAVPDPQAPTVEAEELRRLLRESAAIERKLVEATARIEERTKAARLAIDHIFDRANQHVAIYWHALRRHHRHRDALADEPAPLEVPEWLDSAPAVAIGTASPSGRRVKWSGEKRRAQN